MDETEILAALVAADEMAGRSQTYTLMPLAASNDWAFAGVAWPDDAPVPSGNDIDDLADLRWVRISDRDGLGRIFAVTSEGRRANRLRTAAESRATTVPVDLTWPSSRRVLHLVYVAYREQGAPEAGIKTPAVVEQLDDPQSAGAALRELIRDGYLESSYAGSGDVPVMVRPTPKTIRLEEGWPDGNAEDVVNGLVEVLNGEIDRTDDDEERSNLVKVRDGVLFVARDLFLKWAETKVGGIGP